MNNKVIFWDFDGVILDSMPIRDKGFELVLRKFPRDQVDQLLKFHRENGGLSRYVKFRYFFEDIRKEEISDSEVMQWAEKFSEIMLGNLIDSNLLITDSNNYIQKNYRKYRMHIVSGSDGNELRQICKGLGLSKYFITIDGSPTPKKELVKNILQKFNYKQSECILIGDSINDKEAAERNSIDFYGYNNKELSTFNYIHSFKDIKL